MASICTPALGSKSLRCRPGYNSDQEIRLCCLELHSSKFYFTSIGSTIDWWSPFFIQTMAIAFLLPSPHLFLSFYPQPIFHTNRIIFYVYKLELSLLPLKLFNCFPLHSISFPFITFRIKYNLMPSKILLIPTCLVHSLLVQYYIGTLTFFLYL